MHISYSCINLSSLTTVYVDRKNMLKNSKNEAKDELTSFRNKRQEEFDAVAKEVSIHIIHRMYLLR